MYRIELSPGEETAFRSIEELAVAIRRKVVTSRARIYHNATSKWLPIQFHPHYKIALSMPLTQADLVAGPPVAPLSALKLGEGQPQSAPAVTPAPSTRQAATQAALTAWPEPKPSSPRAAEPPTEPARRNPKRMATPVPVAAAPRMVEPAKVAGPAQARGSRRRSKPQHYLRVALGGAVMVACAQLVVSGTSTSASDVSARPRTPRQLITAPTEAPKDVTPRTVAAVMPMLQSIPIPGLRSPGGTASVAKIVAPVSSRIVSPPEPNVPVAAALDSTPVSGSTSEIEAAPDAGSITPGVPLENEPLILPAVDSSGKQAMKRILRTIGGSPVSEAKSSKQ